LELLLLNGNKNRKFVNFKKHIVKIRFVRYNKNNILIINLYRGHTFDESFITKGVKI
jgi:hypothetical protein